MIVFGLLVAGTLAVAWRSDAAAGAVGAAAALVFVVFAEWAIRANPDMLVLPGRSVAGHRTERHRRIGIAAPDFGRDLRRRIWRRRISGAGPLVQRQSSR